MRASYLFTSEVVSEGHPDKVCDRISDEIVDLFFREGPKAGIDPWAIRAACETLATTNRVVIAGETRGPTVGHQRPDRKRGARGDQGHRLRAGRLPLEERRHRNPAASAVGRHRAGRRCAAARHQQGRGRRRPGHHVRLRHQRDARTDAGADLLRPQDPAADLGSPPLRQGEGAGPGLQEPGHRAIRERQAGRRARDRGLAPASGRGHDLEPGPRARRALRPQGAAGRLDQRQDRSGTSIRPASSSSAVPTAIPA